MAWRGAISAVSSLYKSAKAGSRSNLQNRTPVQQLQDHWTYLHVTFYQENRRQDVLVAETEWPSRLRAIHEILVKEDEANTYDNECMEYFLKADMMTHLLQHVEQNVPVGLVSNVVDFFRLLITDLHYPLLENARVLEVLFKLLHHGLRKSFGLLSLENSLVDLMLHMSDKLQAKPALISLFFFEQGHDSSSPLVAIDRARPPSERSQPSPKKTNGPLDAADFPLFVNLMHFVSHPGRIGSVARAAMLLCVEASRAANKPLIDEYLISKIFFPSSIATILSSLYEALWNGRAERLLDLETSEPWNEFLQLFKLCQAIMEQGSQSVAAAMARAIEDLFCEKSLHKRLSSTTSSIARVTTYHLQLMLQCVNSTWLSRELCVFLLGDPSTMVAHSSKDLFTRSKEERPPLKPILLARLLDDDLDLRRATWNLLYTLLTTQIVESVPLLTGSAVLQRVEQYTPEQSVSLDIGLQYLALLPNEDDMGEEYEKYASNAERVFREAYHRYQQSLTVPQRTRNGGQTPLGETNDETFLTRLFEKLMTWLDNAYEENLCYSGIVVALALHPNPAVFCALFADDENIGSLPAIRDVLGSVRDAVAALPPNPLGEHAARRAIGMDGETAKRPTEMISEDDVDPSVLNALLYGEFIKELVAAVQVQGAENDVNFDYFTPGVPAAAAVAAKE